MYYVKPLFKKLCVVCLLTSVFVFASCGDDDSGDDPPATTVTANAGPDQSASVNQTVSLDGSASSSSDGGNLAYSWMFQTLPQSSAASITNPSSAQASFVPDVAGEYVLQLTVSRSGETDTDEVTITVTGAGNQIPDIDIESDTLKGRDDEFLIINILVSDADNDDVTVQWEVIEGPDAIFSEQTDTQITFTPTLAGYYEVVAIADDGFAGINRDTTNIFVAEVLPASVSQDLTLTDYFEDIRCPDYILASAMNVTDVLTIEPGVVIEAEEALPINVRTNTGAVTAIGTADKRIIFRGVKKEPGSWYGFNIQSPSTSNIFDYVDIYHAASTEESFFRSFKTSIYLDGKLSMTNSSVNDGDGVGLYVVTDDAVLEEFNNNTFTNNNGYPITFRGTQALLLDGSNTYEGNAEQAVELFTGLNVEFTNEGELAKPGSDVPYHLNGPGIEINSTLSIEPGTTILFATGSRLWIHEGLLNAIGTAELPITFDGQNDQAGAWKGVEVQNDGIINTFDYVTVNNGGSNDGRGANIYLFTAGYIRISNSIISNSADYGIGGTGRGTYEDLGGNTFENNATGDTDE